MWGGGGGGLVIVCCFGATVTKGAKSQRFMGRISVDRCAKIKKVLLYGSFRNWRNQLRQSLEKGVPKSEGGSRGGRERGVKEKGVEGKKGRQTDRQTERRRRKERENSNSNLNSKTLFYKDCSLGSVKNPSNNQSLRSY